MYSTTVTSVPNLLYTLPSSSPMTPPPMTTIFFGIEAKLRHPVDETTYFSSMGIVLPGKGDGSEPVAIMIFLALTLSDPPPITSISISF